MRELWEDRRGKVQERKALSKADFAMMERKSAQLTERVINAESAALVSVYENELVKLEEKKVGLSEKIKSCGRPLQALQSRLFSSNVMRCRIRANCLLRSDPSTPFASISRMGQTPAPTD